jgi:hypothetical protein
MSKYDLVRSHIDFVRMSLRETSDDSKFTDEQIYMALIEARALILERRLEKNKELPESVYQTICMSLCVGPIIDCGPCFDDIPLTCLVLQTKKDLPVGLFNGQLEILRVSTLRGKEIAASNDALHEVRNFRKTGKNNFYYLRSKNKINIFNVPNNKLKVIKVRAIFLDPIAAQSASSCDSVTSCDSILNASFGTRGSDRMVMRAEVMKILLGVKQMPEDESNNAQSTPPNQII